MSEYEEEEEEEEVEEEEEPRIAFELPCPCSIYLLIFPTEHGLPEMISCPNCGKEFTKEQIKEQAEPVAYSYCDCGAILVIDDLDTFLKENQRVIECDCGMSNTINITD